MNNIKIKGTELFVNPKHENMYELSLIISNQIIHTFGFNLNNYIKMINNLKQTNFLQNTDYSIDSEHVSSFYITRWETQGIPQYCMRAAINGEWSAHSIIKEKDLKLIPNNLESLIIYKQSEKINLPILPKTIINTEEKIINQPVDLEVLKKEMLGFLNVKKNEMNKG